MVNNDQLRDNISKSITLASPKWNCWIAKLFPIVYENSIDYCLFMKPYNVKLIQLMKLLLLSHVCFVRYEHTYHIRQSTLSYIPVVVDVRVWFMQESWLIIENGVSAVSYPHLRKLRLAHVCHMSQSTSSHIPVIL